MFLIISNFLYAFDICVVGSRSGLGSELIYQSLENNKQVLGLSKNNVKVMLPYRGGGLDWKNTYEYIENKNLCTDVYDNFNKYDFENIIFTIGGKPFEDDYSSYLTEKILFDKNKDLNLKNIVLISAFGVGDSLKNANICIKLMNSWYLNNAYYSKNEQEKLVQKYKKNNKNVNIVIIRPKVLSYGKSIYSSKSRQQLAKEILELL